MCADVAAASMVGGAEVESALSEIESEVSVMLPEPTEVVIEPPALLTIPRDEAPGPLVPVTAMLPVAVVAMGPELSTPTLSLPAPAVPSRRTSPAPLDEILPALEMP